MADRSGSVDVGGAAGQTVSLVSDFVRGNWSVMSSSHEMGDSHFAQQRTATSRRAQRDDLRKLGGGAGSLP